MKKTKKVIGPQIQKLMEMPVTARFVLGECSMEIDEILRLGQGSMLELDTKVEDNMKLYINDEEIAKAKMKDLNAFDIKQATKIICGSAKSMGIEVKG